MSETELAVIQEREACASLLEKLAQDRRKLAPHAPRERRIFFLETADLIERCAAFIRERESIGV